MCFVSFYSYLSWVQEKEKKKKSVYDYVVESGLYPPTAFLLCYCSALPNDTSTISSCDSLSSSAVAVALSRK